MSCSAVRVLSTGGLRRGTIRVMELRYDLMVSKASPPMELSWRSKGRSAQRARLPAEADIRATSVSQLLSQPDKATRSRFRLESPRTEAIHLDDTPETFGLYLPPPCHYPTARLLRRCQMRLLAKPPCLHPASALLLPLDLHLSDCPTTTLAVSPLHRRAALSAPAHRLSSLCQTQPQRRTSSTSAHPT